MSVELTHYPISLTVEEIALLNEAHLNWTDLDKFTSDKVESVKSVIRRVFGLGPETVLLGVTLQDAIVLQEGEDNRLFYALVRGENGGEDDKSEWEAMKLGSRLGTIMFFKDASFRAVLEMLDLSRDMTVLDSAPAPCER